MTLSVSIAQRNLLAVCAVILAAILYMAAAPIAAETPPTIRLPHHRTFAMPSAFAIPASDRFAIIDARPLFLPSRKPPVAAADGKVQPSVSGPPPLPDVTLEGVILDANTKLAMIKTDGAAFAQSVAVGTALGGWSVSEIDADKIILRAQGFPDQTLSMNAAPKAANTSHPQQQQGFSQP